jgi:hypothetical protein
VPNVYLNTAQFLTTREGIGLVQIMGAAAIGNWGGEVSFWLSALAMLASRNLVELEPRTDHAAINRKRAKSGKSPLMDYRFCRIDPRIAAKIKSAGHGDDVRLQRVRGHFKARASGIFWWRNSRAASRNSAPSAIPTRSRHET